MTESRPRFFISDRKELVVLMLLAGTLAAFAFTLGVHFGKRLGGEGVGDLTKDRPVLDTRDDASPNRQELNEQVRGVKQAADNALDKKLHDEVTRTGIKLDPSRQTELPERTVSPAGGATTLTPIESSVDALTRKAPDGDFTLQIGSYASLAQAKERVDAYEALGVKPFIRAAEVKDKGRWYRIYLGGHASRREAEESASQLAKQHIIESHVVVKTPRGLVFQEAGSEAENPEGAETKPSPKPAH